MKRSIRQNRSRLRSGFMLIELAVAVGLLIGISLIALLGTMNVLNERQWVMVQSLADARMSIEAAKAQRIPFTEMKKEEGLWKTASAVEEEVELGVLPGGRSVTGKLRRQRFVDPDNYPLAGGSGTLATNPLGIERWKLVMTLSYEIRGRKYAKARTVLRSR